MNTPTSDTYNQIGKLVWFAVDLCAFGQKSFGDQEHALSEISQRSGNLGEQFSSTKQNALEAEHKVQGLRAESQEKLEELRQYTSNAMDSLRTKISATADDTLRVLDTVKAINKETHLLSLNARVEAARSGEAGAGFSVIAGEIGNLSNRTIKSVADASEVLDLTEIQLLLNSTESEISDMILQFGTHLADVIDGVKSTMAEIGEKLAEIDSYQAVLNEMINTSTVSSEIVRGKLHWTQTHLEELANACRSDVQDNDKAVSKLCQRLAINTNRWYYRNPDQLPKQFIVKAVAGFFEIVVHVQGQHNLAVHVNQLGCKK